MKACLHCRAVKSLDDFYGDSAARDGKRPECKQCTAARRRARYEANRQQEIARVKRWQEANRSRVRATQQRIKARPEYKARQRDAYLRRKYGMSLNEYEDLLDSQGGVCAICSRGPSENISLHVDHDHESGRRRGLLCFRCNNALGDMADDLDRLRAAVGYLNAHDRDIQMAVALAKERVVALRADPG